MSVESILSVMGVGDQALAAMGPTLTILLSWAAGGAIAQAVKFPLSRALAIDWFDWTVRSVAVLATAAVARLLSDSMSLGLILVAAVAQPLSYHASLSLIRRFWPWLEVSRAVGSVCPPSTAYTAAAQRAADRSGADSGV